MGPSLQLELSEEDGCCVARFHPAAATGLDKDAVSESHTAGDVKTSHCLVGLIRDIRAWLLAIEKATGTLAAGMDSLVQQVRQPNSMFLFENIF